MINITDLPTLQGVMTFFEEISKIPRASGNRAPIADYLSSFASSRGLEYYRDGADTVIIKRKAAKEYAACPAVILQGHTDMVLVKAEDCVGVPEVEGVRLVRDGDLLRAKGTTLGGDDGIAVAYMLALLDDTSLCLPKIEALFTSDEEIGLLGAAELTIADKLDGRMLINIDSDCEGIFTVGCAGGVRCDMALPLKTDSFTESAVKVKISGLLGGHSGTEIDKGRLNAIILAAELARLLSEQIGARLISIRGGVADNAIPTDAEISVFFDKTKNDAFRSLLCGFKEKYGSFEPGIELTADCIEGEYAALSKESENSLLSLISDAPFGVVKMSEDIIGLPETSLNLGIIDCDGNEAHISFSVRSSKALGKAELCKRLSSLAKANGASYKEHGAYPAWEYKKNSPLRELMVKTYEKLYGKSPTVLTIHAGLECGLLSEKIEGLDCVSIGPDNFDIHTAEERLSLSSAERVYAFLIEVLKSVKEI